MFQFVKAAQYFCACLFLWPIYWLSGLFPRDPQIWLFGSFSGKKFADNPKYLFLYINESRREGVRPIWISKNMEVTHELNANGFESFSLYSPEGIFYCLRGGIWFFDSNSTELCFWLSNRALKINLWHGIPLKKIGRDDKYSSWFTARGVKRALFHVLVPWVFETPHLCLLPSLMFNGIFQSAFGITKDQMIIGCYPRNAFFFEQSHGFKIGLDSNAYTSWESRRPVKTIFYMPTFRDRSGCLFLDHIDFEKINEFLGQNKAMLWIKAHQGFSLPIRARSNIVVVEPESDPYPLLLLTDILLTDYSSVFFDFLLLRRPIIYFCPDVETYTSKDREFYFKYEDMTPGPKAINENELIQCIEYALHGGDDYMTRREELADRLFASCGTMRDLFDTLVSVSKNVHGTYRFDVKQ